MDTNISLHDLSSIQARAEAEGKQCLVGALISNPKRQAFVQKRAATRRLWPGCWDLAGGHVEPGETLEEALRREVREETGWEVSRIVAIIDLYDGELAEGGAIYEVDFLV